MTMVLPAPTTPAVSPVDPETLLDVEIEEGLITAGFVNIDTPDDEVGELVANVRDLLDTDKDLTVPMAVTLLVARQAPTA